MPYVGFHPSRDPGLRKARNGRRRVRRRATEVVPVDAMVWLLDNPLAVEIGLGRRLLVDDPTNPVPDRILAVGAKAGIPLTVYYLCKWPVQPGQPWPNLAPGVTFPPVPPRP